MIIEIGNNLGFVLALFAIAALGWVCSKLIEALEGGKKK